MGEAAKLRAFATEIGRIFQEEMAHWPTCKAWNDFSEAGWSRCNCHLKQIRNSMSKLKDGK